MTLAVVVSFAVVTLAGFWWFATQSPKSRFLPAAGDARWVLYPVPPQTNIESAVDRTAVFSRTFTLETVPRAAQLQVRAFQRYELRVNGRLIEAGSQENANWKRPAEADVAGVLKRGTNEIVVTVTSAVGPPVLWLSLAGDNLSLASDEHWHVTLEGAVERHAEAASAPMEILPGNTIAGGERTIPSFLADVPLLCLFAAICSAMVAAVHFRQKKRAKAVPRSHPLLTARSALIGVALLWSLLFWNNLQSIRFPLGFDVTGHADYIDYIQKKKALPLADQGWAMHHPPLFHLVSAVALSTCGLSVADPTGTVVLRVLSLLAGLAQVVLVFGCLRLLFPDRPRVQAVGLVLGAFLPAHFYLYHYITNETLATTLGTAVVYACLRIIREEETAPAPRSSSYALLGVLLGAALLTKVTALVITAVVLAVLVGRLVVRGQRDLRVWLRTVGVTLLVCVGISSWHYARVWAHFGTPLVGNYDAASGFAWWQDQGVSSAAYYWRFGRSLVEPYFSGFNSFGDGLYSTFWCDGLWGGVGERVLRPPWNYHLMTAGCLLALIPTMMILIGAVTALVQLIREPRAEWFLLLGVLVMMGVAVLYQSVRFPYYGHAKSFYCLSAVVAICALGGQGFGFLAQRWRFTWPLTAIFLGTWAMSAYASFWVDDSSASTQAWIGTKWKEIGRDSNAVTHFNAALKVDPKNVDARLGLVGVFAKEGNAGEASHHLLQALHDSPNNGEVQLQMAKALQQEQPREALAHVERALLLAPDAIQNYRVLGALLDRLGKADATIEAYRRGLGKMPASSFTHADLAAVLARSGKTVDAIEHYRASLRFRPDNPVVMDRLAWLLATQEDPGVRDPAQAIRLAEDACQRTRQGDPVLLDTLAAAYAEAGRFDDARRIQNSACRLASAAGNSKLFEELISRGKLYEGGKPYRETQVNALHARL
jgi:tetratricopeptide (TPR) repeat protein